MAMDKRKMVAQKLRCWCSELALFALLVGTLWGQALVGLVAPSLAAVTSVESTSVESTQDQGSQSEASHPEKSAGEGARAIPETVISPQEGKELFRSVDDILQFASQDTGLPIEHKVKRRLTKRDEVQAYIKKSMKDDKDAKRLERSSEVLKKFGLLPR